MSTGKTIFSVNIFLSFLFQTFPSHVAKIGMRRLSAAAAAAAAARAHR